MMAVCSSTRRSGATIAIETFAAQVAARQALTITDERMTRYWVSMPEATWLVAQAASVGAPGSVLMLDVPDEVPTLAVARRVESRWPRATGVASAVPAAPR
jgi:FlaA1/EpsC-like NDP-sugar epimerase